MKICSPIRMALNARWRKGAIYLVQNNRSDRQPVKNLLLSLSRSTLCKGGLDQGYSSPSVAFYICYMQIIFLIYGQTLHKLEVQCQGVNCILMVNRNGGDMRRLGMNRVHPGHSQENLSIFDSVTTCLFVIL